MKTQETNVGKFKSKKVVGINPEVLKMMVSGGDIIQARLLNQNSISLVNKASIFVCVNDVPFVSPVSQAYMNRANYITYDRESKEGITEITEDFFPIDSSIDNFVKEIETADAFVYMLCKAFAKSEIEKMKRPDSVAHTSREMAGADENSEGWVISKYDIHEDIDKFVNEDTGTIDWEKADGWYLQFDTIYNFYLGAGNVASKQKFGKELSRVGLLKARKKINGITKVIVVGLRPPVNYFSS